MRSAPSFLACKRCGCVQWSTAEYLNYFKGDAGKCRRCRANEWRPANVYPTLRERAYLLRWFIWQQWYVNRAGTPGADPNWYWKPWNLARVIYYGLTVMRDYNKVELASDNERPRNIETMRAELSRSDASADARLHDATCVLPRQRGNTV